MNDHCIATLRKAIDALELLLDEYQYNHWYDDAAKRAADSVDMLKHELVKLTQHNAAT